MQDFSNVHNSLILQPILMKLVLNCSSHFTLSNKIDSLLGFWFPLSALMYAQWRDISYCIEDTPHVSLGLPIG